MADLALEEAVDDAEYVRALVAAEDCPRLGSIL
jgi:hypothetical protein